MRTALALVLLLVSPVLRADNDIPGLGQRSILKYYPDRYDGTVLMEFSAICGHSPEELLIMKNEIVAKYGRPFKSRDLRDHFQTTSWYKANPAYSDHLLTATDNENIRRIQAIEHRTLGNFPGLLDAVLQKKPLHGETVNLSIAYDAKEKVFIFSPYAVPDDYWGPVKVPRNIIKNNGIDSARGVLLFTYRDRLYLSQDYNTGRHGERLTRFTINFRYDQKTRTITDVVIEGELSGRLHDGK
jgi:hypothetical protein